MTLNPMKALKTLMATALTAFMLTACSAEKNVLYIQNATPGELQKIAQKAQIEIEPGDEIMVFVSCDDLEVSQKLSLVSGTRRPSIENSTYVTYTTLAYLVDDKGDITMPLLGTVHVAGLTRLQVAEKIKQLVLDAKLANANSVSVNVSFYNLQFSAIGEVARPGTYDIEDDNMTLLEALSMAGDLTIHGRRDGVWVIREEQDGSLKYYKVDLRDTEFANSPAYTIHQNDVIYVEPDGVRAGQSTLNENTFKSVGFYTSLISVAISLTTLIVTLTR